MCRPHSGRLRTRGAMPSGWRARRNTLTGGASNAGSTPSWNSSNARLAVTRMPCGRTTIAGYGRWPSRIVSSAWRTGRSASSSSGDSGNAGAKPAARSSSLRSRSVSSIDSASRTTTPRPGRERPCSMKLTCRWVVPARTASSSWLIRRAVRQRRSSLGNRDITDDRRPRSGIDAIPSRELLPETRRGGRCGHDRHRDQSSTSTTPRSSSGHPRSSSTSSPPTA